MQITDGNANDTPGAVTSVGLIRQKAPDRVLADDEVRQLFGKGSTADLNKTLHISSVDDAFAPDTITDDAGLVHDTPVPVVFDSDSSSSPGPVLNQSMAAINTQLGASAEPVQTSSPAPIAQNPPAALMPTTGVVASYNLTSNGAFISDTPVPVIFDEASNSSELSHAVRRLHGASSKPKVRLLMHNRCMQHREEAYASTKYLSADLGGEERPFLRV